MMSEYTGRGLIMMSEQWSQRAKGSPPFSKSRVKEMDSQTGQERCSHSPGDRCVLIEVVMTPRLDAGPGRLVCRTARVISPTAESLVFLSSRSMLRIASFRQVAMVDAEFMLIDSCCELFVFMFISENDVGICETCFNFPVFRHGEPGFVQ